MDAAYFQSLLDAIATSLGAAALSSEDQPAPGGSIYPWAHLSTKTVTLGLDEHQGIQGIRDSDPDFDLHSFLVRVGEMFSAYHAALDRGDLSPVRRFVDEAAYAHLEPAAEKTGRLPDGPRALRVTAIRPITAKHDDGLDLVRIFITAQQPGTDDLLCEYWELVRKRGVLTKPGLTITKCPNCGGPVDGIDPTRCAYCGTRLADPAIDWVVRKITAQ